MDFDELFNFEDKYGGGSGEAEKGFVRPGSESPPALLSRAPSFASGDPTPASDLGFAGSGHQSAVPSMPFAGGHSPYSQSPLGQPAAAQIAHPHPVPSRYPAAGGGAVPLMVQPGTGYYSQQYQLASRKTSQEAYPPEARGSFDRSGQSPAGCYDTVMLGSPPVSSTPFSEDIKTVSDALSVLQQHSGYYATGVAHAVPYGAGAHANTQEEPLHPTIHYISTHPQHISSTGIPISTTGYGLPGTHTLIAVAHSPVTASPLSASLTSGSVGPPSALIYAQPVPGSSPVLSSSATGLAMVPPRLIGSRKKGEPEPFDPSGMDRMNVKRERNRLAAERCRKKKLELIDSLQSENMRLRGEIDQLRSELMQFQQCSRPQHHQ